MQIKRVLSFAAVSALMLSTISPAFAAKGNVRSTKLKVVPKLPQIRVMVPTTGSVYLNPFKRTVTSTTGTGEDNNGAIISVPSSIANLSEVPIEVNVSVTGAVKSGSTMKLSETPSMESTGKQAFMYLEMRVVNPTTPLENISWSSSYDESSHVRVSRTAQVKKNMVTLKAANEQGEATNGGVAAFHLGGDTKNDTTNAWRTSDGVNVTVAFTFTPLPRQ